MRPRAFIVVPALTATLLLAMVPVAHAQTEEEREVGERPGGATVLLASAAYPGLGQLVNGSETRAAVLGVAEGFMIARLILEDRRTRNSYRLYQETGEASYFEDYSGHFDTRQTLVWWTIILALYSIADAYVDANMAGFDEPVSPYLERAGVSGESGVRVGLALRF